MTDLNRAQAERASSIENRQTANGNSIVGVSNKAGFNFNFALTPSESRVECHFRLASPEQTDAAFRALENQKSQIEKAFGGQLIWQARKGKWRRIYARVEGGSDTPEKEWPNLQMELIRTMVRLEKAFGGPLQALPL